MDYPFIHIGSALFPVQPGEAEEIVNPDMWGKALCGFLSDKLGSLGYKTSIGPEDWGWLVEVSRDGFSNGVCIYSNPSQGSRPTEYVATVMKQGKRRFSLAKFKTVDDTAWCDALQADLLASLKVDGVEIVGVVDDMPFADSVIS